MATHQLGFKPQFVDAVASGAKRQTIRKTRNVEIKEGDTLVFWEKMRQKGMARIGTDVCKSCERILIDNEDYQYYNQKGEYYELQPITNDEFAQSDGFTDFQEMLTWFSKQYGIDFEKGECFEGILITW